MNDEGPDFWWRLANLNPVLFRSFVVSVVTVLAMFGILLSPELPDQLTLVFSSAGALIGALWAKKAVVPMEKVVLYQPEPFDNPRAVSPGTATANQVSDATILRVARADPGGD